jgi:predicted RNase H-like nuclease (RuvC/YqgF family)
VVAAQEQVMLKKETLEEEPNVVLQNLTRAEATLTQEKKKLASLKEKLKLKVQKEIESKKSNIQKLRTEITDLKLDCDELSKTLQACEKAK